MRILLCKIRRPFICFCIPSSHIYTPGPFKLENVPQAQREIPQTRDVSEDAIVGEGEREAKHRKAQKQKQKQKQKQRVTNEHVNASPQNPSLRSSFRNSSPRSQSESAHKKKVQWLDFLGKELAEIQEFESSEAGDTESEGRSSRGCVCSIL